MATYLLKHGGYYIRVHPCRIEHVGDVDNPPSTSSNPVSDTPNCVSSPEIDLDDTDDDTNPGQPAEERPFPHAGNISDLPTRKAATTASDLPKIKSKIKYKVSDDGPWFHGEVISRGGKVKGTHWHYLNVKSSGTTEIKPISFRDEVVEWQPSSDSESVSSLPAISSLPVTLDANSSTENDESSVLSVFYGNHNSNSRFANAKIDELTKWVEMKVYQEVEYVGQPLICTRWVCTEKMKGGQLVCKARLVAQGFEEDSSSLTNESPTCSKDSFRIMLSIVSSMNWKIQSIDIKSAFLQGMPLSRSVFLKPPKEAKTELVWKLNQAVYGLTDASTHWYDKVRSELLMCGMKVSMLDAAVFYYHENNVLHGIFLSHADDFLFSGSIHFKEKIDLI